MRLTVRSYWLLCPFKFYGLLLLPCGYHSLIPIPNTRNVAWEDRVIGIYERPEYLTYTWR
jgi:hypothetical protein